MTTTGGTTTMPARARRSTSKPAAPKPKTPKVVEPDTVERQVSSAVARVNAAEGRRGAVVAPVAPTRRAAPTRAPATTKTAQPHTAAQEEHAFDLQDAVAKMKLDYVQCRDFGHSWRPFSANWQPEYNSYESRLQCTRCKTVRTRWLSRSGAQLSGGYDYADGYLVKGMGRLTGTDRDVIRLASITALIPEQPK